jgi:predicted transcriptional regulator
MSGAISGFCLSEALGRRAHLCYNALMKSKQLAEVLERVERWPARAQDELAEIARDIEESLSKGAYEPNEAELAGIDRGLRAAAEGRFATDEQVEAALARLRDA